MYRALPDSNDSTDPKRLDVNDISWLWPAPNKAEDAVSIDQIKASDGTQIWTQEVFDNFLLQTDGEATRVSVGTADRKIHLPQNFRRKLAQWKLAGFRVDPSAPGCAERIQKQFGSFPQIRLILQPVTDENGSIKIHDTAVHLVFNFVVPELPGESAPKGKPDRTQFKQIADELLEIKAQLQKEGIHTDGPLSVHPGLADKKTSDTANRKALVFLGNHLNSKKLSGISLMGLAEDPEPWIFVAYFRTDESGLKALPSPALSGETAQMLSFSDSPNVQPVPHSNNRNTDLDQPAVPIAQRRGVSTAPLFFSDAKMNLDKPATLGMDAAGATINDPKILNRDIVDVVANPEASHFFNTDCLSCHTETTSAMPFRYNSVLLPMYHRQGFLAYLLQSSQKVDGTFGISAGDHPLVRVVLRCPL